MLRLIARLLKVLNSESEPAQISLAVCLSMIVGFTPTYSLHNIFILLIVLLLRVNLSAFILGYVLFSALGYILDPIFNLIGLKLLTSTALRGLWEWMYSSTILRVERFNNTIVMGGLVVSLLLFLPLYKVINMGILKYRKYALEWIQKTRLAKIIKASKFFQVYRSISRLRTSQ